MEIVCTHWGDFNEYTQQTIVLQKNKKKKKKKKNILNYPNLAPNLAVWLTVSLVAQTTHV